MKKVLLTILIGSLAISLGRTQTKLIETVTKKGDEIVIPYEKYVLENGLTLIIHEDHSDPLVHVDVTYHVGSAREELNKSGFAHFFEHMLFQGSENVKDEEHFKIVTESGGTLNGSTNLDRTNYYETVPSNQLETMLWLESDRMGFFLDAVTQKKFEIQRSTVKNERGQRYDNAPYGLFMEYNAKTMYPYGHPYSWLTIGILEDLDRVDVDDLKRFFLRWYGPNNATLSIGGDVNSEEVVKLVQKYFGVIPPGPKVEAEKFPTVQLEGDRYVSYEDANIRFPALIFTFPTVPGYHPDQPALDCLANIIGIGKDSYLYKKFVFTQKAIQSSIFNFNNELAGEMFMFVMPFPGTPLSQFELELREALKEFEATGVSDEDVQKFKATWEANTINGLASVSGKVGQLAAYETYLDNPNFLTAELEAYAALTKEDVIRVYNQYIKGKNAVIQSIVPKDSDIEPAQPDNYTASSEGYVAPPKEDYSHLTYQRPEGDDFERSIRPTPGRSPLAKVPEFWNDKTKNGIKIIGTKSDEIPTIAIELTINGGHKLDMFDPEKTGLASLTSSLLNESTQNYTQEEISIELQKLGSRINVYAGQEATVVSVQTLKKNLTPTLRLMEEILYRPKFDQQDFDRVKKQQLEAIKAQEKQPVPIANNAYNRLIYGENHIFSVPVAGVEETVNRITVDDVKSFYQNYYTPQVSELVVVGDVEQEIILEELAFLNDWEVKELDIPELGGAAKIDKTRIFVVDKEQAPQSEIRIGYLTNMKYDATGEYFKSYLMNYGLGGNFNSRINLNLREDKGFTYGARSSFSSTDEPGTYTASAGVRANVTDSAVYEFMKEITMYHKDGLTEDELTFMKNSIGQRDAREYETPSQKARFLRRIVHYDLGKDFVDKQSQIINDITKKELDDLAKKHLPNDRMNILVVGDKASIIGPLSRLGYEIIELDAKGAVIQDNTKLDLEK